MMPHFKAEDITGKNMHGKKFPQNSTGNQKNRREIALKK